MLSPVTVANSSVSALAVRIVNLAPITGMKPLARLMFSEDYDLVRSILRNPAEGIDKSRVSFRGHNERPAVAVKLSNQHTFVISGQLEVVICGEVVSWKLHRILLSVLCPGRKSLLASLLRPHSASALPWRGTED